MGKNYVVAQDGVRVHLEGPCVEGWIEPKDFKDLQTYSEKELDEAKYPAPKWVGSKMPASLLKQVLGTIHEFPKMETAFSLYYNASDKTWAVKCPEQSGSGAAVSFFDDGKDMPEGFTLCGSIHTHPEMGAFWSGTDLNDQQFKAGIHIVFGLRDGYVHEHKCTVFLPSTQQDQELWDVLEEVDFHDIGEPVKDWVDTIKRQSYHRPVTTKYYSGGTASNYPKLAPGHYGASYAGYSYTYGYPYKKKKQEKDTGWWYGYGTCYDNWGGWYDDYDYDRDYDYSYNDYRKTPAKTAGRTEDIIDGDESELKEAILAALEDDKTAIKFADVLVEPDIRGPLEHIMGITITDSFDKADVLMSIEGFMTGETSLGDMTQEEAVPIFEGLMDLKPDLNVVDENNATGNDINVESLCALMQRAAAAYASADCVSSDIVSAWLVALKEAYETVLDSQAKYGLQCEDAEVEETC